MLSGTAAAAESAVSRERSRRAALACAAGIVLAALALGASSAMAQPRTTETQAGSLEHFRRFGAPSAEFAVLLAVVEVEYLRKRGTDLNRALATNPDAVVIATAHALSEQKRHAGADPARLRVLRSLEQQFTNWLAAVDALRQRRGLPPWDGQRMARLAVEAHQGQHDGSVMKTFGVVRGRGADVFASMAKSGLAGLLTSEDRGAVRLLDQRAPLVAPPPTGVGPTVPTPQGPAGCPANYVLGAWWFKSIINSVVTQMQVTQAGGCTFVMRAVPQGQVFLEFRFLESWGGRPPQPKFAVTGPLNSRGEPARGTKVFAVSPDAQRGAVMCPLSVECLYRTPPN